MRVDSGQLISQLPCGSCLHDGNQRTAPVSSSLHEGQHMHAVKNLFASFACG